MVYDPGKIYRAALIGCGSMGSYCMDELLDAPGRILLPFGHAEILKTHPRTRLVAGADPDRGRLEDFGKRWEVDALYSDHREMLEAERPEIVAIASPPDFHAPQVVDCAGNGVKGIFCEKPFTTTLALADRMIASCRESGTSLAVNHTRRGDPLILRSRRLLDEGGIGQVLSIVATWPGRLFLSGTHWFDLVNYLAGDTPPAWVVGHSEDPEISMVAIPTQRGRDLGGNLYAVYPNGIRAFFNGRDSHAGYRVEVNGTQGVLSIGTTEVRLRKTNSGSVFRELLEHPFPQMMHHTAPMVYLLGRPAGGGGNRPRAPLQRNHGPERPGTDPGDPRLLPERQRQDSTAPSGPRDEPAVPVAESRRLHLLQRHRRRRISARR